VIGPTVITCLKGGVWNDETEPTCSCKHKSMVNNDIRLLVILNKEADVTLSSHSSKNKSKSNI